MTNDLSPEVTIVQLHNDNSDLSMNVTSEHLTPDVTVNNDVTMVTDEIMFATGEIDKHLIGNIVYLLQHVITYLFMYSTNVKHCSMT